MAQLKSTKINGSLKVDDLITTDRGLVITGEGSKIVLANGKTAAVGDIGNDSGLGKVVTSTDGGSDNHIAVFDGEGRKIKNSAIEVGTSKTTMNLVGTNNPWIGLKENSNQFYLQVSGNAIGIGSTWGNSLQVDNSGIVKIKNRIELDPASTNSAITLYHSQNDKRLTIRTSTTAGATVVETPDNGSIYMRAKKLYIASDVLGPETTNTGNLGDSTHVWQSAYIGSGGITSTGTNKFITNTNTFNFVGASGWNDVVYFNWSGGNIKEYRFMKGNDKYDYSPLRANGFIKAGSDNNYILLGGGGHVNINDLGSSGLKIGKVYYGVAQNYTSGTPTTIFIHTKIKYVSGAIMPTIHVHGFAYGATTPIDLSIVFYIYDGSIGWCGAASKSDWRPVIHLFKEGDYVTVALTRSTYYPGLAVDVEMSNMGDNFANVATDNWSIGFDDISIPNTGATCTTVPYNDTNFQQAVHCTSLYID